MIQPRRKLKRVHGMEMFEVVDSWWFPTHMYNHINCGDAKFTGIVEVYDPIAKEYKYYIGSATGEDMEYDEDLICGCGVPLTSFPYEKLQILKKLRETK